MGGLEGEAADGAGELVEREVRARARGALFRTGERESRGSLYGGCRDE